MAENYRQMHDDIAQHDDADFLKKDSEYLRNIDLEDWSGTDFEIVAVQRGRDIVGDKGKKSKSAAIHLKSGSIEKILILNKTNRVLMSTVLGRRPSLWIGERITIWFDESVMFGGERTGGLRVRPKKPASQKQAPKPRPSDEREKIDGIIRGFKMADTPGELKAAWVKGLTTQAAIDEVRAAYEARHEQIAKEQEQPEQERQNFEGVGDEPMGDIDPELFAVNPATGRVE